MSRIEFDTDYDQKLGFVKFIKNYASHNPCPVSAEKSMKLFFIILVILVIL